MSREAFERALKPFAQALDALLAESRSNRAASVHFAVDGELDVPFEIPLSELRGYVLDHAREGYYVAVERGLRVVIWEYLDEESANEVPHPRDGALVAPLIWRGLGREFVR